ERSGGEVEADGETVRAAAETGAVRPPVRQHRLIGGDVDLRCDPDKFVDVRRGNERGDEGVETAVGVARECGVQLSLDAAIVPGQVDARRRRGGCGEDGENPRGE